MFDRFRLHLFVVWLLALCSLAPSVGCTPALVTTHAAASARSCVPTRTVPASTVSAQQTGDASLLPEISPYTCAALPTAPCVADTEAAERAAALFRTHHPFHNQTIALSEPFGDQGCRTLIVAEPPPHATRESIAEAAGTSATDWTVRRHDIGVGGWVTDLVVNLPPLDADRREELVSALHAHLYGTTYKAEAAAIVAPPKFTGAMNLNVQPGDIDEWLHGAEVQFVPVLGGASTGLKSLTTGGEPGVYMGVERGLVAWVLRRGQSIDEAAFEARVFGVDSDLVVGAVAGPDRVVLLGRERVAPMDYLPPLRFETLRLLAGANQNELGQSFERTHVAAAALPGGGDWAPIYLSNVLVDTEYGSLLNIADQLLKSWSNHGFTRYSGFQYAKPGPFPFGKPLPDAFTTRTVTYNWNTDGFAWSFDLGDAEIMAVGTTGCLPMKYLPDGTTSPEAQRLEREGFEWFASTRDPILARVASYTTAYQVFRRLGITASPLKAPDTTAEQTVLRTTVESALRSLHQASAADVAAAMKSLKERTEAWVSRTAGPGVDIPRTAAGALTATPAAIAAAKATLAALPAEDREARMSRVAGALAFPRETSAWSALDDADRRAAKVLLGSREAFVPFIEPEGALKAMREAQKRRASGWIRTPAVVMSSNSGHLARGGHNVAARMQEVTVGSSLSPAAAGGAATASVSRAGFRSVKLGYDRALGSGHTPRKVPDAVSASRESVTERTRGLPRDVASARGMSPKTVEVGASAPDGSSSDILVRKIQGGHVIEADGREIKARSWKATEEAVLRLAKARKEVVVRTKGYSPDEHRGLVHRMHTNAASRIALTLVRAETRERDAAAAASLANATITPAATRVYPDGSSAVALRLKTTNGEAVMRVFSPTGEAAKRGDEIATALRSSSAELGAGGSSTPAVQRAVKNILDKAGVLDRHGIIEVEFLEGLENAYRGERDDKPVERHAGTTGHSG